MSVTKDLNNKLDAAYAANDLNELLVTARRLALKMTRYDEDAAQVMTFHLHNRMDKYKPQPHSRFSTWARKVLKNARVDFLRAKATRPDRAIARIQAILDNGGYEPVTTMSPSTSSSTSPSMSRRSRVSEIVFPSPRAERAFTLQMEGQSTKQIAEALGWTHGSLRVEMSRWKKKMSKAA